MRIFIASLCLAACATSDATSPDLDPLEPEHAAADTASCDDECEVDPTYDPVIDPARFVTRITNPLFPLEPGSRWTYVSGDETIEVTVLLETKTILGVTTTVVHDVASVGDEVIEDTFDWYAQDLDGAVWYFGEDTRSFEDGEVSTEGSWEAGVDGAKPGVIIPANPEVGQQYRQEYYACEAEDLGEIVSLCATAKLPIGTFKNCLQTLDTTPLEPDVREHKFYCPGVGLVLAIDLATGEREMLVERE